MRLKVFNLCLSKMETPPTTEQLQALWNREQKRKAYLANYAKLRRDMDEVKDKIKANSRAYYWRNREAILAKRHPERSASPPSEPTLS
jgi:hypothetical protein